MDKLGMESKFGFRRLLDDCFIRGTGMFDLMLLEQTSKCSRVGLEAGVKQKTPMTLLFCVDPNAN